MSQRTHLITVTAIGAVAAVGALVWALRPSTSPAPTLLIGAVVAQTSPRGQSVRQGLELAVEALDAESPAGQRLGLELLDPGADGSQAQQHLAALEARGVHLVADLSGPEAVLDAAGLLRTSKLIVMTTADDPRLAGLGPRLFTMARTTSGAAGELAGWGRALRVKRPALIVPDTEQGEALYHTFVRALLAEVRLLRLPAGKSQDAARWLAGLVPPADGVALLVPEAAAIVQELHASGAPVPLVFTTDAALGKALAGGPAAAALSRVRLAAEDPAAGSGAPLGRADASQAERERVTAAWRKRFGAGDPPAAVFEAWDAVHALVRASRAAGGDPEQTLALLRATQLEGASGSISFLGDGGRVPPTFSWWRFAADGAQAPWSMDTEEAAR